MVKVHAIWASKEDTDLMHIFVHIHNFHLVHLFTNLWFYLIYLLKSKLLSFVCSTIVSHMFCHTMSIIITALLRC